MADGEDYGELNNSSFTDEEKNCHRFLRSMRDGSLAEIRREREQERREREREQQLARERRQKEIEDYEQRQFIFFLTFMLIIFLLYLK